VMTQPVSGSAAVIVTGRPSMADMPSASIAHMAYASGPPAQLTWIGVVTAENGYAARIRPSADCACSFINFFATAGNARAWARRNPEVTGRLLTQEDALRSGVAQFGTLLRAAP